MTERVIVGKARNGQGLLAAQPMRSGKTIFCLKGRLVSPRKLMKIGGKILDNSFRYGPETYLNPENELGSFLNHSCQPNAGVRKIGRAMHVFSIEDIDKEEEITIDYSTILGDDDIWTMKCRCGSENCRRIVRKYGTLPLPLRNRYEEEGIVPRYILSTLHK